MNSNTQRIVFWIGAAVAIIAVFGLLIWVGRSTKDITPLKDTDWAYGDRNASVVLTEYADFQCQGCAQTYPLIKQAEKEFGGKLVVVFRHYPLSEIHPNALPAARAAEAAGKQGKFWEMHDLLFERQNFWKDEANPEEKFVSYAVDVLGLNKDRFQKDYHSDEIHRKINEARESGEKDGVNSTPTLFINGKRTNTFTQSYDQLKEIITNALPK